MSACTRFALPPYSVLPSHSLHLLTGDGENQIDSRTWLNIVGFLLKRTATKSAKRVAREMAFDWSDLLPWEVLKASQDQKLTRFVEDRRRRTP